MSMSIVDTFACDYRMKEGVLLFKKKKSKFLIFDPFTAVMRLLTF